MLVGMTHTKFSIVVNSRGVKKRQGKVRKQNSKTYHAFAESEPFSSTVHPAFALWNPISTAKDSKCRNLNMNVVKKKKKVFEVFYNGCNILTEKN